MGNQFRPMIRQSANRLFLVVALCGLLALLGAGTALPAAAVGRPELNQALLSTVRVAVPMDGQRDAYSTGSGTVLSDDGFILTNFHVMGDNQRSTLFNREGVAFIAVNPSNLRGLPNWLYQAELVKADPDLDLAVLKITAYLESQQPLPDQLGLVTMGLADSDEVAIGDELSVIGFPGIGGDTVTFTQGKVSGFLDENQDDVFEWVKTDAEVNHGNSGGLAINEAGLMIGVPTAGVSDVEAAGKISLIRPINLALPLIRAASGLGDLIPTSVSPSCGTVERHPTGATLSNLVFAEAVDRQDNPSGVRTSFERGLATIYAVFDYDRFRNGHDFTFTWYLDDEAVYGDTLEWSGGSRGREWVNIFSEPSLPTGLYRLELRLDDVLLGCGTFSLGKAAATPGRTPAFGPITFARSQSNDRPVGAANTFASGTSDVYAFFSYSNLSDGLDWRQIWYVDGEVGLDTSGTWGGGQEGTYWVSVNSQRGLPDGAYALELYVEGQLLRSGEFRIGSGDGPALPASSGVVVVGTVVDANRRSRPIDQATVIFLEPGVQVSSWLRTQGQADVYASGVTNGSGQFQLSRAVVPGTAYPIVAIADGYRPVSEQSFVIPADAQSPFELDITMVTQ